MSEPTETLTKIARAIWNIKRKEEDRYDMELEDMGLDHSVWIEARAALEAMRNPTTDVIQTGAANITPWWSRGMSGTSDYASSVKAATSVWEGMIDAILDVDSFLIAE